MLFIERRSGPRNELRDLQHVIIRLLDVPQGQVCIGSYMSFPRLPLAPVQEVRLILYHFWFLSIFYLLKKKKLSCFCGRRWSKDNSWEGSLLPCKSQGRTQAVRLCSRYLYSLNHCTGPLLLLFEIVSCNPR